jgi:RNA polymerase sigma-70 factor, ECF subfamily
VGPEVIEACKRGDREAFAQLYQAYHLKVFRTVYLLVRNKAVAEDIVQDIFVKLFHALKSYDDSRPFEPWLYKVAVNTALSGLTKQPQWRVEELAGLPSAATGDADTKLTVRSAIGRLKPAHRIVIILKFYNGLTEREIAEAMSSPLGTVKSRLFFAKAKLRKALAQEVKDGLSERPTY